MLLRVALAAASRPLHGRPGSPCTSWPRRKENTCALIGKAMNHRAACVMDATLFSYRFLESKRINLLELESLISLLRRSHVKEYVDSGCWYFSINAWFRELSRKGARAHEGSTSYFENWGWGASLMTSHWIGMGVHLGESSRCPISEHIAGKLACLIAEASPATDRRLRIRPCPLGTGSAP